MRTRRKQRGGKRIGEGRHGIVYNLCSDTDHDSFCDELATFDIHSITLSTLRGTNHITDVEKIRSFVRTIRKERGKIVKILKSSFFDNSIEMKYNEEIEMNRSILSIYKDHSAKYLTIEPVHGAIGGMIVAEGHPPFYIVFGTKCANHYALSLPSFLTHLLESIVVLNNHDMIHNDIKPDNVVKCGSRYKLIDWGGSRRAVIKNRPMNIVTTNPLAWYCYGYNSSLCSTGIPYLFKRDVPLVYESNVFQKIYATVWKEFALVTNRSREEVHEEFKYTFDVFQLGMSLLLLIYNKPAYHKKYIPVVQRFTSLLDPFKNAKEALEYVRSIG